MRDIATAFMLPRELLYPTRTLFDACADQYPGFSVKTEIRTPLCEWGAWSYAITSGYTIPFSVWEGESRNRIKTAYWPEGDVLYMMEKADG
jgi:hypothetical protein